MQNLLAESLTWEPLQLFAALSFVRYQVFPSKEYTFKQPDTKFSIRLSYKQFYLVFRQHGNAFRSKNGH